MCAMEIMHTMASEAIAQRRNRRYYSPELKTQVMTGCQAAGSSVAGKALTHGINGNIVLSIRQREEKGGPLVRLRIGPDFAAMPRHDAVHRRQPDAGSWKLRG